MARYESLPIQMEAHKRLTGVAGRDALLIFLMLYDPKGSYWKMNKVVSDDDYTKVVGWMFTVKATNGSQNLIPEGWYCMKEQAPFKGFYPCNPTVFKSRYKKIK